MTSRCNWSARSIRSRDGKVAADERRVRNGREPVHQDVVAFADDPEAPRLRCANVGCVVALKQAAFGRTRPPDDTPVERDFHDVYLLLFGVPDAVVSELSLAEYEVRTRATDAISQLARGGEATIAAARQMIRLGAADSQRAGGRPVNW